MTTIRTDHPLAVAATTAIHTGDLDTLRWLLHDHPELARARLGTDDPDGMSAHAVARGHRLAGPLPAWRRDRGAAGGRRRRGRRPFRGPNEETPLHWAASSDDVAVLDALLDAGADINAPGAVIGGGPPLADATAFRQWKVAYRLVERGAEMTLWFAAGLELMDRLESYFSAGDPPSAVEINRAFWGACHGGRLIAARYLHGRGAELDWIPLWGPDTPLDAASTGGNPELVTWLHGLAAKTGDQVRGD